MQTSTNLFVDNRWDTSATSEGTIKYLREGSTTTAAICVKRWQNLEFMPFDELSAAQWMRHRHTIAEHFKPPVEPEEKKEEDNSLVTSLLEALSVVQRKQWLAKNPQYKEKICLECGCFNPAKKNVFITIVLECAKRVLIKKIKQVLPSVPVVVKRKK